MLSRKDKKYCIIIMNMVIRKVNVNMVNEEVNAKIAEGVLFVSMVE